MTAEDEYRSLRLAPLGPLGPSPLPPPPAPLCPPPAGASGDAGRYHHGHSHHGQHHWPHHSHTLPHLNHYERERSADRYAPPPSPASSAHSDRERDRDRYLPPPAPAPMDRYLLSPVPPPGSQPIERYVPPPAPSGSAPTADRYAGNDVYNRFHHHYRTGGSTAAASAVTAPAAAYPQQQYHQYHTLRAHGAHGAHGHQQHRYNHHHVVTPSHGSRGLHHIRCCQTASPGAPSAQPGGPGGVGPGPGPGPGPAAASAPYSLPSPSGRPSSHGLSARLLPTPSSSSSSASSTASAGCGRHSSTPPPLGSLPLGRCSSEDLGPGPAGGLADGFATTRTRRCAPPRYASALPPPVQSQGVQTQTGPAVRGTGVERRESRDSRDSRESASRDSARDARDNELHAVAWRGVTGQQQQQPAASPTPSINVSSGDSQHSGVPVLRTHSAHSAPDRDSGGSGSAGSSTASTTTASLDPPASPLKHHLSPQLSAPAGVPTARTQSGCTVAFSTAEVRRMSTGQAGQPGQGAGSAGPSRHRLQRQQSKSEMVRNYIKRETAAFFGVDAAQESAQRARWVDRRKRLAARKYGELKDEYAIAPSLPTTPVTPAAPYGQPRGLARPDVLPLSGPQDVADAVDAADAARWEEPPVRRKESVAKMTFSGVAYVVSRLARQRAREPALSRQLSRSIQPSTVPQMTLDDVRLRTPSPTLGSVALPGLPTVQEPFFDQPTKDSRDLAEGAVGGAPGELSHLLDATGTGPGSAAAAAAAAAVQDHLGHVDSVDSTQPHYLYRERGLRQQRWARRSMRSGDATGESSCREVGMSRIGNNFLELALDNSDRRQYGMGVVGRLFGRSLKRSVARQPKVREQLEDIEDHRPYFTYWVTTVQILILVISIACYGVGTIGVNLTQRSGLVLTTSLQLKQVDYTEPANFWVGPRAADLIHLGAKFGPCMRKDAKILKEIEESRMKERNTACCIRNDESGCVQSSRSDCSYTIETWKKWSNANTGPGGRISGSVCGLDPKYCEAPASIAPYEWPDDITKWPICRKTNSRNSPQRRYQTKDKAAEHMVCEVIGHPCCFGIHGSCEITTKEYCDFVRGYFHEEASLCSQVSCLDDVCGMIPFYSPEVPDQFYRLWTSLFLHAGVLHLFITVIIQYFLMKDLEKLTGAFRIGLIYIGSGVAGNLASAIFVPYRAEVGPAGSQFGLLACLIVEILNVWPMLKRPAHALLRLLGITLFLFVLGLLPWVDNYAHVFGFIFGFLLSYALLPFVSFGPYDRQRKIALIWVCLLSSTFLFAALIALFYVIPVYDCEICTYFNCLPLTRDFCAEQNINLKRDDGLV